MPITEKDPDHRAKRITAYLNLLQDLIDTQIKELKESPFEKGSDVEKYFDLLPATSPQKKNYHAMMEMEDGDEKRQVQLQLKKEMIAGGLM